ncbi:MAG: PAS domain-containing sensor histidine kinase [Ekhidna sp.]
MKEVLTSHTFHFMDDPFCRAFLDSTRESIIAIDKKGHILYASKKAYKMFGYEADILNGKMFNMLVPIENAFDIDRTDIIQTKALELDGIHRSGSRFPVEVSLTHVPMGEGILLFFVSERSKESSVIVQNDISRQYFDIAEVILLALNQQGEIIDINKKGCEVLEYTTDELIGKNWFEISVEKRKELQKVFLGVLSEAEQFKAYNNHIITKTGQKKLIHWQNTVVKDNDGNVIGSLSSGMDITEKNQMLNALKESEEKLRSYSEDLELQVVERTKELQELLDSERDLNELKSKFVSLASHEFRTPLSTILSSAALIAKYPDTETNDKRLKHVNRIKSSVNHLSGILEDFLSLDRLNEGKVRCHPEPFEMEEVFAEVLSTLSPILKPGQTLEASHSGITRTMHTDKKLVRNILVNLTSNAIKYSPENQPIHLRCKFSSQDVVCEVEDNGIGIPEEDQIHLFERFFRANNTRSFQGTGLGLSIVKRYVELLNGKISFESRPQEGTTFTVTFPIKYSS